MWGRPASPRPAGLEIPPRGHRLSDNGSDLLLEMVDGCTVAGARPAGLPLAHLGLLFCRGFTPYLCIVQGSGSLNSS